jgi:hypothetical protein
MAQTISQIRVRPAKDEWGVYDPEQAGLAALYARLDNKDPKPAAKVAATPADAKDLPAQPKLRK